jgi:hypothetical protein
MSDQLTHALLASILHLIQRDIIVQHPARAAPRHLSLLNQQSHCASTTAPVVLAPSYHPMHPSSSPPHISTPSSLPPFGVPYTMPQGSINLGRLTGPSEGSNPFTVARPNPQAPGMCRASAFGIYKTPDDGDSTTVLPLVRRQFGCTPEKARVLVPFLAENAKFKLYVLELSLKFMFSVLLLYN